MNLTVRVRANWVFCGYGLGKDVFDDLQLLKNEFKLKTILTLTQNANPKLRVRAKLEKMWILRLGLGLRWTWRLGLGQIESFLVMVLGKDVFDDFRNCWKMNLN